jgi:hypothetical protein
MASASTFRARHLTIVRDFVEAYEEMLQSREEWIALGGAAYTDEVVADGGEWTTPTEAQFDDSMYAIGQLENFMTGAFNNDGSPQPALDENVFRLFFYRVAN